MITVNLDAYFKEKGAVVEQALSSYLKNEDNPMREVMQYSVLSGGKRFRPILLLATVESLGRDSTPALPAACALEMVHCFSLVHDDLPCMDDDDYRRGIPSCHKRFSEAEALLAGDGLLAHAFQMLFPGKIGCDTMIRVVYELAAGTSGMINGQYLEFVLKREKINEEALLRVHRHKTGALIRSAVRIGAILAEAAPRDMEFITNYGEAIGLLFQIVDDILDCAEKEEDMSFSSFYGIAGAREKAENVALQALDAIKEYSGEKKLFEAIVEYLINRKR